MAEQGQDDTPLTDDLVSFAGEHPALIPSDYVINAWRCFVERKVKVTDEQLLTLRKIFDLARIGNRSLNSLRESTNAVLAARLRNMADQLDAEKQTGGE